MVNWHDNISSILEDLGYDVVLDPNSDSNNAAFITGLGELLKELSAKIDAMQIEINNLK